MSIFRAALGRPANLGDLYDAVNDQFCGLHAFKKKIPESAITVQDDHFTDVRLTKSEEITEKFSTMNVEGELQVSFLAGLLTLAGSGKYLSDNKTSNKTIKSSLVYNVNTTHESLNIGHEDLADAFSLPALESKMPTHIVMEIWWGANAILSCSQESDENLEKTEMQGNLKGILQNIKLKLLGEAENKVDGKCNYQSCVSGQIAKLDFRIYGDLLTGDEEIPTTIEQAVTVMKKFPNYVKNSNDGKGKPLRYKLLPISELQQHLKLKVEENRFLQNIEEANLNSVVTYFAEFATRMQDVKDFADDVRKFHSCVKPRDRSRIYAWERNIREHDTKMKSNLCKLLPEIRSGKEDMSKLQELMESLPEDFSPDTIYDTLSNYEFVAEKIDIVKTFVKHGAYYKGWDTSLKHHLLRNQDKAAMIYYFSHDIAIGRPDVFEASYQTFIQELKKKRRQFKYYVVDCDTSKVIEASLIGLIQIQKWGKLLVEDFLAIQRDFETMSLDQFTLEIEQVSQKPMIVCPLVLPCPGDTCDSNFFQTWKCNTCFSEIEFGFDDHIYCKCGKVPAHQLEFKCNDEHHGIFYQQHKIETLRKLLAENKPPSEINILLLGETGVGKTTFINGFRNFLAFETLEDAENGNLLSLIPSKFTICDENYQEITVKTGSDTNENYITGESGTQNAKVYQFPIGNMTIRIIDTPGIGDTRGIEQDKKNFENVLGTLSYFDKIHGICILLKPNHAKLNVMFRFCIKELLQYLHKDASRNIVFCFTNCRGTFYRPGDTLPPLRVLLSQLKTVQIPLDRSTIYCFDSEAYRFLAAIKHKPKPHFSEVEHANFAASWNTSLEEVKRLIRYFENIEPHKIQSTVNLNTTRELVIQLSRPLGDIRRTIHINKEQVEKEKKEIEVMQKNIEELKSKKIIKRKMPKSEKIEHPKTVCGHKDCIKIWDVSGTPTTVYSTVCHSHCYLEGIPADTIGDARLMECEAFQKNKGKECNCGHHYSEHLHIYYNSTVVEVDVEDQSVVNALKENWGAEKLKDALIRNKNEEIAEYENELEKIQESSVRFAFFLKNNAITPYNDAQEDYLKYLIRQEKENVDRGFSAKTLEYLERDLLSYRERKGILEASMTARGQQASISSPGASDIANLVDELKNLKHSGQQIQEALECINHAKHMEYREFVVEPTANFFHRQGKRLKKSLALG